MPKRLSLEKLIALLVNHVTPSGSTVIVPKVKPSNPKHKLTSEQLNRGQKMWEMWERNAAEFRSDLEKPPHEYQPHIFRDWDIHATRKSSVARLTKNERDIINQWTISSSLHECYILDLVQVLRDTPEVLDLFLYYWINTEPDTESFYSRVNPFENLDCTDTSWPLFFGFVGGLSKMRRDGFIKYSSLRDHVEVFPGQFERTDVMVQICASHPNLGQGILIYALEDFLDPLSMWDAFKDKAHLIFELEFDSVQLSNLLVLVNHAVMTDFPEDDLPLFSVAMTETMLWRSRQNCFVDEIWLEYVKTLLRHNLFMFPNLRYYHALSLARINLDKLVGSQASVLKAYEFLGIRPLKKPNPNFKFFNADSKRKWLSYFESTFATQLEDDNRNTVHPSIHLASLCFALEHELRSCYEKLTDKKTAWENHLALNNIRKKISLDSRLIGTNFEEASKKAVYFYNEHKHKKSRLGDGESDLLVEAIFETFDLLQSLHS